MPIPIAAPTLDGNELAYLTDCIESGWVSSRGKYVRMFEDGLAAWCGSRHGVATSSGTGALHLALLALEIGSGDEVIVPALSYVASANAIAYTGARPVFVDVDLQTWNLDLDQIEPAITPRTRAIMPVHLYGHPVDMAALMAIAERHGLWVVEDACQAHGAEYKGRRAGSLGHVGCFSFFGNKLITTGEGGMLVTAADELAAKARSLRDQATVGSGYDHHRIGFSYRMTNLQAAVGLAQLERVDSFLNTRQKIQQLYDHLLSGIPGLTQYTEPDWAKGVCWLYSLVLKPEFMRSRDELIVYLAHHQVESKPFFKALPSLSPYRDGRAYPAAETLARHGISLPTSVSLTQEQIGTIAGLIRQAVASA